MGAHRRKWGWWLVLAIAMAVAASLLYRRCTTGPDGPAASAQGESADAAVVRDTVFVEVDGETVPVVTERPAEPVGERPGGTSAPGLGSDSSSSSDSTPDSAPGSAPTPAPGETVIAIPVKELTGFIREKSGRDISVSTQAPDRISVSYSGKIDIPMIGEQEMNFTAGFKVVEVKDDRLVLKLDSGAALNAAADLIAPLVLERLPDGLVESFSSGRAVVNLSAVPQYSKRLSGRTITAITVDEGNIRFTTVKK